MANLIPKGRLVTPVAFGPSGELLPLQVDSSGNLLAGIFPHSILLGSGVTAVLASATANNNTVDVYTVPASKTFYLTLLYMTIHTNVVAGDAGYAEVVNAALVQQYYFYVSGSSVRWANVALPLTPPAVLTAGWKVRAVSGNAGTYIPVTAMGYTI